MLRTMSDLSALSWEGGCGVCILDFVASLVAEREKRVYSR